MAITEGTWHINGDGDFWLVEDNRCGLTMAKTMFEHAARFIASAHNACAAINQEHPQAVIDALPDMLKALKAIRNLADGYIEMPKDLIREAVNNVIAKIEGSR